MRILRVIDSVYTDPDAIRKLYLNRRAIADMLPGADPSDFGLTGAGGASLVSTVPSPSGGGTGGGSAPGCPAFGQFTLARSAQGVPYAVLVDGIRADTYELWNPIARTFKRVIAAEVIHSQPCAKVTSLDGCESIVSLTDPVIQSFADETGRSISELIAEQDADHGIVTSIECVAAESRILSIESAGWRSVVKISLEGGGIYASGSDPQRMTVRHNNKEGSDNGRVVERGVEDFA